MWKTFFRRALFLLFDLNYNEKAGKFQLFFPYFQKIGGIFIVENGVERM